MPGITGLPTVADLSICYCHVPSQWTWEDIHLNVSADQWGQREVDCEREALYRAQYRFRELRAGFTESQQLNFVFYDGVDADDFIEDDDDYYDYAYREPDTGRQFINDYSYRPEWIFHGDGPIYTGAEIEVESYDDNLGEGARLASQLLAGEHYGLLKYDGSLDNGMEVVTMPMSYDWAIREFPWQLFTRLSDIGFRAEDTCGIHVHVNRSAFTKPSHVYRWLGFIYRNPTPLIELAGRGDCDYSSWHTEIRPGMKGYAKGQRGAERYSVVNVNNSATFEVRMFAGSLSPDEIKARIAFVHASVEYTAQLTANRAANGGWSFGAFVEWLQDTGKYPELTAYIDLRIPMRVIMAEEDIRPAEWQPMVWTARTRRESMRCDCDSCTRLYSHSW